MPTFPTAPSPTTTHLMVCILERNAATIYSEKREGGICERSVYGSDKKQCKVNAIVHAK